MSRQPPINTELSGPLAPDVAYFRLTSEGASISELPKTKASGLGSSRIEKDGWDINAVRYGGLYFNNPASHNFALPENGTVTLYIKGNPTDYGYGFYMVHGGDSAFFRRGPGTDEVQIRVGSLTKQMYPSGIWDGKPHWVSYTYRSNVGSVSDAFRVFLDGNFSTQGTNNSTTPGTLVSGITIGMDDGGYWQFDGCIINHIMIHSRHLADAEIRQLHANPWQIFQRRTILVPTFPYLPYTPYEEVPPPPLITITDVNTTETWTDGDTGLVITGTGFV